MVQGTDQSDIPRWSTIHVPSLPVTGFDFEVDPCNSDVKSTLTLDKYFGGEKNILAVLLPLQLANLTKLTWGFLDKNG